MPVTFDDATRKLLDDKNFATIATVNSNGSPQSSVVWFVREDDTLLISVTSARQKARNLARDPRISVSVYDLANPYHSVEVRGTAELIEDRDKSLPYRLSHRYLGQDPPEDPEGEVRLIVRVIPERRICEVEGSANGCLWLRGTRVVVTPAYSLNPVRPVTRSFDSEDSAQDDTRWVSCRCRACGSPPRFHTIHEGEWPV